jgi:hypothetical protein
MAASPKQSLVVTANQGNEPKWTTVKLTLSGHQKNLPSTRLEESVTSIDPTPEQVEAVQQLMRILRETLDAFE